MTPDEERIALFLDYENLALGAREQLHQAEFDFGPIADALAERGRVVVRRAYADWTNFENDRRMLTRHSVELIEIPQKMGAVRKNAADIKMAVDAIELCLERDYITTFVLGTGDSDFTPLVHKLRELNRRVIGVGVEASTSGLLPPACDEFLFYERLEGIDLSAQSTRSRGRSSGRSRSTGPEKAASTATDASDEAVPSPPAARGDVTNLTALVTTTLAGLERSSSGPVLASMLKRTILRKDPTFNEADYGFRGFGELMRHLADRGVVVLGESSARGDPEVTIAEQGDDETAAFLLLRSTIERMAAGKSGPPHLSGLKTQMRKSDPDFTEKRFGFGGFLQFARAARARGFVDMDFDETTGDYVLRPGATPPDDPSA